MSELVRRVHDAGALRADNGAGDIPLIPVMIGAVMDGARHASPELWPRMLAVVIERIAAGPRTARLPGEPPRPCPVAARA